MYGCPQHFKQKRIWDILHNVKDSISRPWAILGDFNEILHPHEKLRGPHGNASRMHDFAEFIDNCIFFNWNLLDYHLPSLIKGVIPVPFLKNWIEFL